MGICDYSIRDFPTNVRGSLTDSEIYLYHLRMEFEILNGKNYFLDIFSSSVQLIQALSLPRFDQKFLRLTDLCFSRKF